MSIDCGRPSDDRFLEEILIANAVQAALQRNVVYRPDECTEKSKTEFRNELMRALRSEAQNYMVPVSESDHCAAIRRICGNISKACGSSLKDDRLRYGTVQKAFNLYLKFLWKLGKVAKPPHCPIDSIVLASAGINGSWTKSDCETEYLAWITKLKEKARSCDLATWEDQIWLQNRGAIQ